MQRRDATRNGNAGRIKGIQARLRTLPYHHPRRAALLDMLARLEGGAA